MFKKCTILRSMCFLVTSFLDASDPAFEVIVFRQPITKENAKVKGRDGNTVLHYITAIRGDKYAKSKSVINDLIKHGADINARNNYGETPLLSPFTWTIRYKDRGNDKENPVKDNIPLLIEKGANFKAIDNQKNNIFHLFILSYECYDRSPTNDTGIHSKKMVQFLLSQPGAKDLLVQKNNEGKTPVQLLQEVCTKSPYPGHPFFSHILEAFNEFFAKNGIVQVSSTGSVPPPADYFSGSPEPEKPKPAQRPVDPEQSKTAVVIVPTGPIEDEIVTYVSSCVRGKITLDAYKQNVSAVIESDKINGLALCQKLLRSKIIYPTNLNADGRSRSEETFKYLVEDLKVIKLSDPTIYSFLEHFVNLSSNQADQEGYNAEIKRFLFEPYIISKLKGTSKSSKTSPVVEQNSIVSMIQLVSLKIKYLMARVVGK
ncbi:MAG: hypothetical protein H6679_01235 [Epsilonproteobacteria bacterium]|nr:hypothetical protein [Campylobacterota bacterium]